MVPDSELPQRWFWKLWAQTCYCAHKRLHEGGWKRPHELKHATLLEKNCGLQSKLKNDYLLFFANVEQFTAEENLCFISKPNKPPTKPSNLRPLGIIRPDGKGLAGACRDLLASFYLQLLPQFAYQP